MSYDANDLRSKFVGVLAKEHIKMEAMKRAATLLISDQGATFFEAPYSGERYETPGGLAKATLDGYLVLRIFAAAAEKLIGTIDLDRAAMMWICMMSGYWGEFGGVSVRSPGYWISPATVSLANAKVFGFDLSLEETEIMERILHAFPGEPPANFALYWTLSQTMRIVSSCTLLKR